MDGALQSEQRLSNAESEIERSYDCDWEDPVHDSFMTFVEEFSREVDRSKNIVQRMKRVQSNLKQIDIDGLSKKVGAVGKGNG